MNASGIEDFGVSNDRLPIGTIPIFATSSPEYQSSVSKMINAANNVFAEFLNSDEGIGFCGHVCLIGDSMGAIMAYDALCREHVKRSSSDGSVNETPDLSSLNNRYRNSSGNTDSLPPSPRILTDDADQQSKQFVISQKAPYSRLMARAGTLVYQLESAFHIQHFISVLLLTFELMVCSKE